MGIYITPQYTRVTLVKTLAEERIPRTLGVVAKTTVGDNLILVLSYYLYVVRRSSWNNFIKFTSLM